MKLAWVTPVARQSAIGRISVAIAEQLAVRGNHLTLIASDLNPPEEALRHPSSLAIREWRDVDLNELDGCDSVLIDIGDNYNFHAGIFKFIDNAPALGIFHDFFIYNLFRGWLAAHSLGRDVHDAELLLAYGPEVSGLCERIHQGGVDLQELAQKVPMTEWLGKRCQAAVAHAKFYAARLEQACAGPVSVGNLSQSPRSIRRRQVTGPEVVITTVGVLNPNKCADRVIQAIGSSDFLRNGCEYRLVGRISPAEEERLVAICQHVGFQRLRIVGEVDEARLEQELSDADIICALRNPVLEGASASAIEAMMVGRVVVVANAGSFAELPDCVVKLPAAIPVAELASSLEVLARDPSLRHRLGQEGRTWALRECSTSRYATFLEAAIAAHVEAGPCLKLVEALGADLARLGVRPNDPAVDRIAAVLQGLCSTPERRAIAAE